MASIHGVTKLTALAWPGTLTFATCGWQTTDEENVKASEEPGI